MSYRLVNANQLAIKYPEVNDMDCIYVDLPGGLDNEYHTVDKSAWIPLKKEEDLPSEIRGRKVLGCDRVGLMMVGYICKDTTGDFGDTGYFIEDSSDYLESVVAWMPLPKTYEKPKQMLKEADKSGLEFADMPTLKEG